MSTPTTNAPVALVTGAGRGFGRAICEAFHAAGYSVIASDYNAELLQDLEGQERYHCLEVDVSSTASTAGISQYIADTTGRLDVLVNNAGIIGYFPSVEMPPEALIQHFQVNSFGAIRTVHACLDALVESGGRVLNITSESYRLRTPFQMYQSTKLALEGISDVQRRELALLGVGVASIRPGAINTALFTAMQDIENPVANSRLAKPFANFVNRLKHNPPKSVSTPEDMAALVLKAAQDKTLKPHYEKNNMLGLKLAGVLPSKLTDKMLGGMLQ